MCLHGRKQNNTCTSVTVRKGTVLTTCGIPFPVRRMQWQWLLRPILTQLDLQSVDEVFFSTFAWAFARKMLGKWSSSRQNESEVSPKSIQSCFRASPGAQLQEISVSTFSTQLSQTRLQSPIGSKITKKTFFSIRWTIVIVFDPVGSKQCWRRFPANRPLQNRETALHRSWRYLLLILTRRRPISNIFGAKPRTNVLKGTFSTDCKSNCIRISLRKKWGKKMSIQHRPHKVARVCITWVACLGQNCCASCTTRVQPIKR